METNIEIIIRKLINGETVSVPFELRPEVQKRLREIKNHCTIVLSQIKNYIK